MIILIVTGKLPLNATSLVSLVENFKLYSLQCYAIHKCNVVACPHYPELKFDHMHTVMYLYTVTVLV
jgi:hypothetical protein